VHITAFIPKQAEVALTTEYCFHHQAGRGSPQGALVHITAFITKQAEVALTTEYCFHHQAGRGSPQGALVHITRLGQNHT